MILRSLRTFSFGLILGLLLGSAIKFLLPSFYYYFLLLLERKTQVQTAAIGSYPMAILLNNSLASFLCAYGGYFTAKVFLLINSRNTSSFLKKLSVMDKRIAGLHEAELKYYLPLHALPIFILSFTGFVLGSLSVLYSSNPREYFLGLIPHGLFEIPAILLAGSIGYTIAEAVFAKSVDFEAELTLRAKGQKNRFLIVLGLIIIAAFLEA
jgi:uncharacterized membrane protein SpoIIM required for sporulation